jgi:hypothetical protein
MPTMNRAPKIPVATPLVVQATPKPVRAPVRHKVVRPRAAPVADTAVEQPERTVKEGRIVDPFAGLK